MKKLVLGLLMSLLAMNSFAATTVSVTAHTANTTALSATENTNNSNLANGINTHNAATTGEHGVTGTIVGTSDTQTLTNKTLTSPTITTSPTAAGATWTDLGTVTTVDINGGTVDASSVTATTALILGNSDRLYLDGGGDTYIKESSTPNEMDFYAGGVLAFYMTATGLYSSLAYSATTGDAANLNISAGSQFLRSTSARKYKTNERDLILDKTKFMKLKPIVYNSKCEADNKTKDYIGIVADDAIKIYPELVSLGIDGEPEGFNYERLTVILLKAVQEQAKQIDDLTKRIEKLEAK